MKILVIFTGGTIGSRENDNGIIAVDGAARYELIEGYKKDCDNGVEFDTLTPYSVLSENLSARELNLLTETVYKSHGYDGIIVTHGTDTIQYSAAALSYMTGNDCTPTLLVSSNYPLKSKSANGRANFAAAVSFICAGAGRGVFVPYRNTGESFTRINNAVKLISYPELSDTLLSLEKHSYATESDGRIKITGKITGHGSGLGVIEYISQPGILTLSAMPGDSFCYDLSRYRAVLLRPYHSATLNTGSGRFRRFCANAADRDIPIFLVNAKRGAIYESATVFDELGIIRLENSAFAAAYMKLWAGISLGADLQVFMTQPICGEFD